MTLQRCRGSVNLFHKIQSIVSNRQWATTHIESVKSNPCILTNIALLPAEPKRKTNIVCISHINTRSIGNEIHIFHQCMMDDQIDVCVMMETWLKPKDDLVVKQVPPHRYKILSYPWHNGSTGGGLAIIYRDFLQVKVIDDNDNAPKFETKETRCLGLEFVAHWIVFQVVYRIPNTSSILTFCNEFCNGLEAEILSFRGELFLPGDFNIHMDDLENTDTILFSNLLDSFNLVNKFNFPSHKLQHTLDLAINDSEYSYLSKVSRGHMLSGHNFIHCDLTITKPPPPTKW